jgi:outer membrane receptor protein involved in Fe transport
MSMPALAQQSGGTTETVVVTGSRIPQTGLYSTSPVTAVNQQELKFEGTTDVTTLVNNLPSVFVDQNAGVSNGASGTANVDLRGLGAKRTLVLVDGTRLMPGDPQDPVADLNDIPAALVDHVDVLTGGASAVYGSDALGGVVNFVMRHDFEGVEVDGTYTVGEADNNQSGYRNLISEQAGNFGFDQSKEGVWNGQTEDTTFLIGSNTENGKGNITGYLSYRSVAAVWENSRDYSACTMGVTGPHDSQLTCAGSANYNAWVSLDNYVNHLATYTYFETGKGAGAHFVPFTGGPGQLFNYGGLNYIQRPDTRYTGGFFAHYDENKELNLYANFMFADDQTQGQLAPSAVFLGSGTVSGFAQEINCSNPLMTAAENKTLCGSIAGDAQVTIATPNGPNPTFTYWGGQSNLTPGQALLEIGRRDIEGGNRQYNFTHESFRMQIGAKGDLGNGWSYDVYAQEGYTSANQDVANQLSKSRVQEALEVDPTSYNSGTGEYQCYGAETNPPTGPGCVPLNLFAGFGAINKAQLAYSGVSGLQQGFTEEQIVSGSITGDLGQWGGQSPWAKNPIAVSLGSEYRQERLGLSPDEEEITNDLYGAGGPVTPVPNSGFNVTEGFTEVKVPVIQEMPWVEDFTLNGGYRYSSYNIAGATNTYKYGAEWQPIDDFRIRGSVQRAVRAPNVLELFSPDTIGLFSGQDPCSAGANGGAGPNATELHNCAAATGGAHVNSPGSPILTCPATQCNAESGGNINLKPEVSETRTIGMVITPSFFDGFNATVDWFNIKVNKFISDISPNLTLDECYDSGPNPNGFFCNLVHRNPVSEQIFGTGFVAATGTNTGYLQTKGIDFETNYTTDLSNFGLRDLGSVDLNVKGTWLTDLSTSSLPGFPAFNCAGLYGEICGTPNPKWRQYTRVTWSSPWDVDFSLAWRYIGAVGLDADTSDVLVGGGPGNTTCPNSSHTVVQGIGDCWDARVSSYSYFDLSADWTVREGVDLRGGVNNVFGIDPPVIGTSELPLPIGNGNTFAGLYDTLGRTFFAGVTIKY